MRNDNFLNYSLRKFSQSCHNTDSKNMYILIDHRPLAVLEIMRKISTEFIYSFLHWIASSRKGTYCECWGRSGAGVEVGRVHFSDIYLFRTKISKPIDQPITFFILNSTFSIFHIYWSVYYTKSFIFGIGEIPALKKDIFKFFLYKCIALLSSLWNDCLEFLWRRHQVEPNLSRD